MATFLRLQQLAGIDYGEHVILIYPNLDSLREIYSQYCRNALEDNELVLLEREK
jgi:hypothetical protein